MEDLGHRIPPGQSLTKKFPVTGEKSSGCDLTLENYTLDIESPAPDTFSRQLSWEDLSALPTEDHVIDIHCVTSWSRLDTSMSGIRLGCLLEFLGFDKSIAGVLPYVRFEAWSQRNHDTSLPLEFAWDDSWLVHTIDGKPLAPEHGFPLRLVTPSRYFYKSLKWLKKIELMDADRLGFWERTSAYHNVGLPWNEQRFDPHVITNPDYVKKFKASRDFHSIRQNLPIPVILKANFSEWNPASRDLTHLEIKASQFRGAVLAGVDFSYANLTLSKFPGADLSGARFIETDLEGVDFSGTDLRGATFINNPMSAAVFGNCDSGPSDNDRHRLSGMSLRNPFGLLESQAAFLNQCGIQIT